MAAGKDTQTTFFVPKPKKDAKARVILVVDYDEIPDTEGLRDLVSAANGVGSTTVAELHILQPSVTDITYL